MDMRRSFYLASRQEAWGGPLSEDDERWIFSAVPYITPANDNSPVKNTLPARCGTFLRRLAAMHNFC
jgi:hypothetical protein